MSEDLNAQIASQQRPHLVWVITIIYIVGVAMSFPSYVWGVRSVLKVHSIQPENVDIMVYLISDIIRGIGVVRLFFLRWDAWIYVGMATILNATLLILNFIEKIVTNQPFNVIIVHEVFTIFVIGIWIGFTVAIYRLCESIKVKNDASVCKS